jgi:hypothetical protein
MEGNSVAANVTEVTTQLQDGSTVAAWLLAADDTGTAALTTTAVVQGARSYSFNVVVSAAERVSAIAAHPVQGPIGPYDSYFSQGIVAVFMDFGFHLPGTGGGDAYDALTLPPCGQKVTKDCAPVSKPTPIVTRRRLLSNNDADSAVQYYTCLDRQRPCNNSLLAVQVSVPGSLSDQYILSLGVQTQGLNILVSSPLIVSRAGKK